MRHGRESHVEDIDRTGRDFDRDGIRAAFAAVQAHEIDALVVYEMSRPGRSTSETLATIKAIRGAGAVFVSVAESIDDSPEGELALTLFLGMAQHSSDVVGRPLAAGHHLPRGAGQAARRDTAARFTLAR